WAATVITNMFTAVPIIGDTLVTWIWGGFSVDNPTLNRFYSFHFILPFLIFGVVFMHLWALHVHKSGNPLGIDVKGPQDTIPFHPYYTAKDMFGMGVFMTFYLYFVFFQPNLFGEVDNYIPANPLQTPPHIVPEWYFLPYYAILRAVPEIWFIPAKLGGVIGMLGSICILFILPWLDTSKVRSARFRPIYKYFFWFFVIDCFILGWVGANSPDDVWHGIPFLWIGRAGTIYYFAHFIIFLPLIGWFEPIRELPESITKAVTGEGSTTGEEASK
ncbi:MAG: cytochrome b N-terminal domain-containing protein, partial [Rhodospirillales bacterium]|nr:cytochrome b N-terminal domain-containing protein [Rhodospirillales bacterium]